MWSYKGRYVEKNEYKCSIMTEVERYADLNKERQDSYKYISIFSVGWCGWWAPTNTICLKTKLRCVATT